jgi:hypothetical protein
MEQGAQRKKSQAATAIGRENGARRNVVRDMRRKCCPQISQNSTIKKETAQNSFPKIATNLLNM